MPKTVTHSDIVLLMNGIIVRKNDSQVFCFFFARDPLEAP